MTQDIPVQEIQQTLASCVEMNTANLDEDVPNALFEEDARLDDSVFIDPTITVNGEQVRTFTYSPMLAIR